MQNENQELLELILVAQTLTLANTMKIEAKQRGINTTANFHREAAKEIVKQRSAILSLLAQG